MAPITHVRSRGSSRRVLLLSVALGFAGCMSQGGSGCGSKGVGTIGDTCRPPTTPDVHGKLTDDRVDVTASEAWPNRAPDVAPAPADVATACAAYAACVNEPPQGRFLLRQACERGALSVPNDAFALMAGERVIPFAGSNESFPFFVRTVIALGGDCAAIRGVLTERPDFITCQEDGCYADGDVGKVTCSGDVATILHGGQTSTRDCARAGAKCSETSETGCTDRPLVGCEHPAKDRCDGDVKLGCDHCGLVSFHDCSWNGGHCQETSDGADCVNGTGGTPCFGLSQECAGEKLHRCISGTAVEVDCAALGMHCEKRSTGVPELDGGTCGLSPCAAPECVLGAATDGG